MRQSKKSNVALWIAQGLLAALFLFAGVSKFTMPVEALTAGPIALPLGFIRFIGVAEVAGALGLLLPGIFRVAKGLTPIAAAGLACIMSGAVAITAMSGQVAGASVPFIVLVLVAIIALGRGSWVGALARR